ncbi:cytochrome-c peroxidase [Archangium sp.]|uniref:cytochrome-c peroxidase n=1 Tax=Archangium sp. TaxID=1872627 RepID=UPI00389A7239
MRRGAGVSWMLAALLFAGAASAEEAPQGQPPPPKLPPGVSATLWKLSVPPGAEPTPEKVALGQKLFLDKRLSADDSTSCSTCHDPDKGFVDGKPLAEGVQKRKGKRNSPTVLNAMFNATQFWDGRAATLEEQAKLPILNPVEMAMPSPEAVVAKVRGIPEYASEFQRVFGREVNYDDLAAAIAAFERTQFSGNAPFDRFLLQGDEKALEASARRGWALFNGKGRCNSCHAANATAPLFSDQKFHNIGIAAHKQDFVKLAQEGLRVVRTGDEKQIDELALQTDFTELGRFLVTKYDNDIGAFKTPTLRNIGVTAPYMHDGSLATLWDVMDHYNKGGIANPFLDGGMQRLGLTEPEIDDLVAFLFTLTDERYAKFNAQEQAKQRARKNTRPERDTAVALGKKGNFGDIGVSPNLEVKNPADVGAYGGEAAAGKTTQKAKTPAK